MKLSIAYPQKTNITVDAIAHARQCLITSILFWVFFPDSIIRVRSDHTDCLACVETCLYNSSMSPKELTAFRIEPEIMDGLRQVKDRDGVPFSVQIDRALRAWLKKKGVLGRKAPPAPAPARKPAARRVG